MLFYIIYNILFCLPEQMLWYLYICNSVKVNMKSKLTCYLVFTCFPSLKVVHTSHVKNKYDFTCVKHVYTLPTKISSVINWIRFYFFCIFASVASILIGKDNEYDNAYENFGLSVQGPFTMNISSKHLKNNLVHQHYTVQQPNS